MVQYVGLVVVRFEAVVPIIALSFKCVQQCRLSKCLQIFCCLIIVYII